MLDKALGIEKEYLELNTNLKEKTRFNFTERLELIGYTLESFHKEKIDYMIKLAKITGLKISNNENIVLSIECKDDLFIKFFNEKLNMFLCEYDLIVKEQYSKENIYYYVINLNDKLSTGSKITSDILVSEVRSWL